MFGIDSVPRTGLDWLLAALAGAVLVALVGIGAYGAFTGFLQSRLYLDANEWVALICGLIGAGCALYLVLELTGGLRGRLAVGVCFFAFMFSIFAVSKGVPAAATALYGKPTVVRFVVTGFDWGGKNCSRNVVAKHPDYEDFQQCIKYFQGMRPEIGRTIEVSGMGSAWGIVREHIEVRP